MDTEKWQFGLLTNLMLGPQNQQNFICNFSHKRSVQKTLVSKQKNIILNKIFNNNKYWLL